MISQKTKCFPLLKNVYLAEADQTLNDKIIVMHLFRKMKEAIKN